MDVLQIEIDALIRKIQRKGDTKIKDRHDKHVCIVCGGSYTRQNKKIHVKTKKHKKSLEKIYNELYNLLFAV